MVGQRIRRLRRRHLGHEHRSLGGTFHRADPPIGNDPTAPRLDGMGNHRPPWQEPGRLASSSDHTEAEVVYHHGVDAGGVVAVGIEEEKAGHGQRLRSRSAAMERSVAQLSGGTGAGVMVGSDAAWRRAADGSRCRLPRSRPVPPPPRRRRPAGSGRPPWTPNRRTPPAARRCRWPGGA